MKYRRLGKTNFEVSEVSLGTWQLGEAWGSVSDEDAVRVLQAALDHGINFFDTADVYGDGRSERFIAQVLAKHTEKIYVRPGDGFSHISRTGTIAKISPRSSSAA